MAIINYILCDTMDKITMTFTFIQLVEIICEKDICKIDIRYNKTNKYT